MPNNDLAREMTPHFDDHEMATGGRTQNPGTLLRDPAVIPQDIRHARTDHPIPVFNRASDKFAIRSFAVVDLAVHELLYANPHRKRASIWCVGSGQGIMVGTMQAVSAYAGRQSGTLQTNLALATGCLFIPVSSNNDTPWFLYECKAPLFYTACGNTDGNPAGTGVVVQSLDEMFDNGVPIT